MALTEVVDVGFGCALNASLERQSKATAAIAPRAAFKLHHVSSEACRLTSGRVAVYISTTTEIILDDEDVANIGVGIEAIAIVQGHFWTGIRA